MREKCGLDATGVRILSAVQKHGPLSKAQLAEIVNLSPTPCWERLTRLKAAGFIRGQAVLRHSRRSRLVKASGMLCAVAVKL